MDQEHETNLSPEENAWLDEILPPEDLGEELGPHESVEDAGLVSPDAPEDGWDPEARSRMTGEPFQDEEFRDTFGEGDELNAAFADENAPEEAPEAPIFWLHLCGWPSPLPSASLWAGWSGCAYRT